MRDGLDELLAFREAMLHVDGTWLAYERIGKELKCLDRSDRLLMAISQCPARQAMRCPDQVAIQCLERSACISHLIDCCRTLSTDR